MYCCPVEFLFSHLIKPLTGTDVSGTAFHRVGGNRIAVREPPSQPVSPVLVSQTWTSPGSTGHP